MRRRKVYVTLCLQSYRSADSYHPKKTFCGEMRSRDHDLLVRYNVKSIHAFANVAKTRSTGGKLCNIVSYQVPKQMFRVCA